MKPFSRTLAAAALAAACAAPAFAQTYPTKPVRIIVPFPPGQASDVIARLVGQKMSENLGQQVVVDNRVGAGGNIGSDMGAKAPPDGYTLTMATAALPISASVYAKLPFDPVKDFATVTLMTVTPLVLIVHPALPVRNVKELVALARSRPGQLNFASSGMGTSHHLSGEMLRTVTGVNIVHVPYKGSQAAHIDLMSGQVAMMFDNILPVRPMVQAGKLKALAVTTPQRSPALPDVPTIAEAGLPNFEAVAWFGMLAPAGTPRDIVTKLNGEIVRVLKLPDVNERLSGMGAIVVGSTPDEFATWMRNEVAKWAKVVKAAGVQPQ